MIGNHKLIIPEDVKKWNLIYHKNICVSFMNKYSTIDQIINDMDCYSSTEKRIGWYLYNTISLIMCNYDDISNSLLQLIFELSEFAIRNRSFEKYFGQTNPNNPSMLDRSELSNRYVNIEYHLGMYNCYKYMFISNWLLTGANKENIVKYLINHLLILHTIGIGNKAKNQCLFKSIMLYIWINDNISPNQLLQQIINSSVKVNQIHDNKLKQIEYSLYIVNNYLLGDHKLEEMAIYAIQLWYYYSCFWENEPKIPIIDDVIIKLFWANLRAQIISKDENVYSIVKSLKGF